MKLAICGDVHWSQYSSIVRRRGTKYSKRLENLIESVNWFNQLSSENNCFANFYLGDFFDKSDLNAEECAALSDIKWSGCSQYFLCGNHEMESVNHKYSSAKVFNLLDIGEVIDKPTSINLGDISIHALPYILDADRKPIAEYFKSPVRGSKNILISHNDIAGIQMGRFESKSGFTIDELESLGSIVINGHLHNGAKVSKKVINIGNITGQNFSEDAAKYDHVAFILDTDTMKISVYENPVAYNFYKLEVDDEHDFAQNLKHNSVVTVKCNSSNSEYVKQLIKNCDNIVESHLIIQPVSVVTEAVEQTVPLSMNHLSAFKDYVLANVENTQSLVDELNKVIS